MNTATAQAGVLLIAAASAGCESTDRAQKNVRHSATAPTPVVLTRQQELKIDPSQRPRPIRTGQLPLVYLVETPSDVRVVDSTAGIDIARATAGARSLVSIT